MFTTVLDLLGVALVVAGVVAVAFICWPAALVVAGAGLLWASWWIERGRGAA